MQKYLHYLFVLFLIPTFALGMNPNEEFWESVNLSFIRNVLIAKRGGDKAFRQPSGQDRINRETQTPPEMYDSEWVRLATIFMSVIPERDGSVESSEGSAPSILEDYAFELFALEMGHDLSFINAADLRRMRALYATRLPLK